MKERVTTGKWICWSLLVLLVVICLFYGFKNSNCLLNSDEYAYLTFGKALAEGSMYQRYDPYRLFADRVRPGEGINLHYGTRNYRDGLIYSGLPIGFPFLISLGMRIGGLPGALHVNVFILFLFVLVYFLAVREFLWQDPCRDRIALLAAVLILSVDNMIFLRYSLVIMRDLSAITFFWLGLFLLLRARRAGLAGAVTLISFSVLILGFSATIRLTNAIYCLPLGLYALLCFGRRIKSLRQAAVILAAGLVVFVLAFSPILLENWSLNRNPFTPFSQAGQSFSAFFSGTGKTFFSLDFFLRHLPSNLGFLWETYSITGLLLCAAGLIVMRRRSELWLILFLTPAAHLLFYSMFEEDFHRYLIPLFPFITVLGSIGVSVLLSLPESRRSQPGGGARKLFLIRPVLILCLAAGVLVSWGEEPFFDWRIITAVIIGLPLILPAPFRRKIFPAGARWWVLMGLLGLSLVAQLTLETLRQKESGSDIIERLRDEIEEVVPPGSIIWGARFLVQNVDVYTHAWSLDPMPLCGVFSLSLREVNQRVIDAGIPLFTFDNKGLKTTSDFLLDIERNFDLEKVKSWRSADLGLDRKNFSQNEWLTLCRIRPWANEPVELAVSTPEKIHYLVLLDLKNLVLPEGNKSAVRLFANGVEMMSPLLPGINFIFLPVRLVTSPETSLRIVSDVPLPRDILVRVVPAVPGYCIELGKRREVPDYLFLRQGFTDGSRSGKSRSFEGKGRLRIPLYYVAGYQPVLKIVVKNNLDEAGPVKLRLMLNEHSLGERIIEACGGWQTVEIPIPAGLEGPSTADLTIRALCRISTDRGPAWTIQPGLLSFKSVFWEMEKITGSTAELDPAAGEQ
ncbi:MAG: hypothetical protein V1789_05890 [PVC group bacterium]